MASMIMIMIVKEDIDVDDDGNDGNRDCRDCMPCKRQPIKVRTKRLRG